MNSQPRQRKNHGKKSISKRAEIRYVALEAVIETTPRHDAGFYLNGELDVQVAASATLFNGNGCDRYFVRFTGSRNMGIALKLQVGDRINVQQGRFHTKRNGFVEFVINKFEKIYPPTRLEEEPEGFDFRFNSL